MGVKSSRSHSNSEAEPGGQVRCDLIVSKLMSGAPSRYQALCLVEDAESI